MATVFSHAVAGFAISTLGHAPASPTRLVLAGADGWGTEEARAAVAASGVATRIVRVRWVPDEALPALLRQAAEIGRASCRERV